MRLSNWDLEAMGLCFFISQNTCRTKKILDSYKKISYKKSSYKKKVLNGVLIKKILLVLIKKIL